MDRSSPLVCSPRSTPRSPWPCWGCSTLTAGRTGGGTAQLAEKCAPPTVGASHCTKSQPETEWRGPHLPPKGSGVPPCTPTRAGVTCRQCQHTGRVLLWLCYPQNVGATVPSSPLQPGDGAGVDIKAFLPSPVELPPLHLPSLPSSTSTLQSRGLAEAPTEETRARLRE